MAKVQMRVMLQRIAQSRHGPDLYRKARVGIGGDFTLKPTDINWMGGILPGTGNR